MIHFDASTLRFLISFVAVFATVKMLVRHQMAQPTIAEQRMARPPVVKVRSFVEVGNTVWK
jgi:hypothetical protein